jgi:hypothetical protein
MGVAKVVKTVVMAVMVAAGAVAVGKAHAETLMVSGVAYTQDFNTLAISGTTNSTLPAGWALSESGTSSRVNQQYAGNTGSDIAGDVYSYGVADSAERALGSLRSGTLAPMFGSSFVNSIGSTITDLDIAYTGEMWRQGATPRTAIFDRLDFQYSLDATSLTTGTWSDVNALDFSTPLSTQAIGAKNGNFNANRAGRSGTITGLSIADGATFWIRWIDFSLAGNQDGLAVDDFSLTATAEPVVTVVPLPAAVLGAPFLLGIVGILRMRQSWPR